MDVVSSCPICFETLNDKIKASPDNCEHIFCLPCLEKWSKLGSYCPVDRKRFKKILNLDSEAVIQVKSHKRKRKRRVVYDFTTHCEICTRTTNANVMLLCDCCDLGYHIHCLSPPLKVVPAGLWFCPTCISVEEKLKEKNGITKEVEAELGGFSSDLYKTNIKEKKLQLAEKEPYEETAQNGKKDPVLRGGKLASGGTRVETASYSEDSVPSSTCVKNKPSKGTSKNLIPFSVFQRIEGIDASQEICSQISELDVPFPSKITSQYCMMCKDEFFDKSEKQCKLCKLKYFNNKESKRFSNCVKNFKDLHCKKYKDICFDNKMRFDSKLKSIHSSVLERRKRSLICTLKKIRDSKSIINICVN